MWIAPSSLKDAERRRLHATNRLQTIQLELGDRSRKQSMSADEFWRWRNRTIAAQNCIINEVRRLKQWIKDYQIQKHRLPYIEDCDFAALDLSTDIGLLSASWVLLRRLAADGVDLDPDEQKIVDAIRERLVRE